MTNGGISHSYTLPHNLSSGGGGGILTTSKSGFHPGHGHHHFAGADMAHHGGGGGHMHPAGHQTLGRYCKAPIRIHKFTNCRLYNSN